MAKVKRIIVSNLKAISAMSADLDGCTAIITGGNRKGKSSFLRSLPDRIRGIKPDVIVKHGATEGEATWELTTGEKFIWKFTNDKERLIYISDKDIKSSVTKDITARYFPPTFDVDKFLLSGPAKQRITLQGLVGLNFARVDADYKVAYDDRTWANRKAADEQARVKTIDPTLPTDETPVDDLLSELAGIDAHNQKYEYVKKGVDEKHSTQKDNKVEIDRLQLLIDQLHAKNELLQSDIDKGISWLDSIQNKPKDATVKESLTTRIATIRESNKAITDNNATREQALVYAKAQEEATKADERVKMIEDEKDAMIKSAKLPEGFGFSDDGITYNKLPFSRESLASSELYIAALKLAAMTLGEVKTLHFDASYLDNKSLSEIEQWAEAQDLQLLIEMPDREGGEIAYELINTSE
jgi:hypothetical protein